MHFSRGEKQHAAKSCVYLLGAAACAEKLFTVFPAALERRLGAGTGVVTDEVLLQMLHHPEHQRTAVPLSKIKKVQNQAQKRADLVVIGGGA